MSTAMLSRQYLGNKFIVRFGHSDRSEQLLQIVRELLSASVPFTRRIHCYEDSSVRV